MMRKVENQNKEFKQACNEGGLPHGIVVAD